MKHGSASTPFMSGRRRALAAACRQAPRTRSEIARQLGVERGSIETVLTAMVREDVLEKTSVARARGAAFRLRDEYHAELDAALAAAHPPGVLSPGLRVLIVGATKIAALAAGLRAAANDPRVVWAVRGDGPARFLLALEATTPEELDQVDRLQAVFADVGAECIQVALTDVMDGGRLRQYVRTLGDRPHPELPSG
jgi:hypothetical protein